jgi:prepilin-type N-terminal cleavage/methylation domain-containing protein
MISRVYRQIRSQAGMSLAEVLVASSVVGVGLSGLLSAVPLAGYGIHEGQSLSTATFLANQRLEEVRNAQWTTAPACPGPPNPDTLGVSASAGVAPASTCGGATTFPDETPMATPYAGYTRTVRITDCGVGPGCGGIVNSGMRQIVVSVSYTPVTGTGQAAAGTTKAATVSLIMAQR